MARLITFDNSSLQSTTIKTQEAEHESIDGKDVNIQRFGNRDGGKIVNVVFPPKTITLNGVITGTSIDNLEANIDAFKEVLNRREKNLDIAYASGTRRFKASCKQLKIIRQHYHVTFAEWQAVFVITNPPFGTGLDTSSAEFTGVGTNFGTFYGTFTAQGTKAPMPTIRMNINGHSGMTKVQFTNTTTGGSITVEPVGGFTAGDILLINTDDYTVTINGTAVDYTGSFPEFAQGDNDFKRVIWSTYHSVDLKIIYRPLYL